MKVMARGKGKSAIAAAAYRSASRIENQRDGIVHDFTRKQGVAHAEIVLPEGCLAEWARDRSALWNAAELSEKRSDARVAREFEIALPHELDVAQRIAVTQDFAQGLANRFGAAVDFAIHEPVGDTDIRNVHAHVLMTTRRVQEDGLGEKTQIERENKWLLSNNLPTTQMQLREVRQLWEEVANLHLVRAGQDISIDHRSHAERGLEIEPTMHMGVHAVQMQRQGMDVTRSRLDAEAAARNAELIREKPEQVLTLITGEKSVFDRYDIARTLHRYINDDAMEFQNAFAAVMASTALVEVQPERAGRGGELARYSTREMIDMEAKLERQAGQMASRSSHKVDARHVDAALESRGRGIVLSAEQRAAVAHITAPVQMAAVVGLAGAGKSTMLAAAREAFEAQGYQVHGAALSGKAAEGLEESSGIASRTLASWEYSWQAGRSNLSSNDVLVIDEAGMIGSRQLARFVDEASQRGAKIVLVGDHEQLQAIGAGAPFRAITERIGAVELQEVRRQREEWQRQASIAFASHRTGEGLAAYGERGLLSISTSREEARPDIVRDYLADREAYANTSRIVLAHRRADVRHLNAHIRAGLQERGVLPSGEGREFLLNTNDGVRAFAPGDRIVLLENYRELGVKNGMLGTVQSVQSDELVLQLDGREKAVALPVKEYQAFDHGYATTIHKSQGATVDRAFVLASSSMDRHLTYVAMTRHRDSVKLYAGQDEFARFEDLAATLGRSGAKETTLDYPKDRIERNHVLGTASPAIREPEPLVPAVAIYSRSIEDVAREEVLPQFERQWKDVLNAAGRAYNDPTTVTNKLREGILSGKMSLEKLKETATLGAEQADLLRGKRGWLGDDAERKQAREYMSGVAWHAEHAKEVWERWLGDARRGEQQKRDVDDKIIIPGLSVRSAEILRGIEKLAYAEQPNWVGKVKDTPEGQRALEEARDIQEALNRRFGHEFHPTNLKPVLDRCPLSVDQIEKLQNTARLTDTVNSANGRRERELRQERSQTKGLGLGM